MSFDSVCYSTSWTMADPRFLLLFLSVLQLFAKSCCFVNNIENLNGTEGTLKVPRLSHCPISERFNLTGEIPDELGMVEKSGYVFPRESIWLENGEMFGCFCYVDRICLPMCCPKGLASMGDVCVEDDLSTQGDHPPFHSEILEELASIETDVQNWYIFTSDTCNHATYHVVPSEEMEEEVYSSNVWKLMDHADVSYNRYDSNTRGEHRIYGFEGYCLSRDVNSLNYSPILCKPYSSKYWGNLGIISLSTDSDFGNKIMVTCLGMIISVPFLVMTFVVYTILPEMKNIHGLTLRGYVGCLAVGYTALAVVENNRPLRPKFLCHFSGFAIQFSFLASFFWLNVMCFDIWRTFRSPQSPQKSFTHRKRRKILIYSMYAWGCAILFTVVCAIMNYVPGIPKTVMRPKFGLPKYCWFKTSKAKTLYFYGPMGSTVLCNIYFFVSTAVKIIRDKKDAAQHLAGTDSKRHDDNKQRFNLYLKLFIVMGVNWATEIISWFYESPEFLWYVTDMANVLQGVMIFLIFICKKKIKDSLAKRFRCERPKL